MDNETSLALMANILKATETRFQKHKDADEAYITELRQLLSQQMHLPKVEQPQ